MAANDSEQRFKFKPGTKFFRVCAVEPVAARVVRYQNHGLMKTSKLLTHWPRVLVLAALAALAFPAQAGTSSGIDTALSAGRGQSGGDDDFLPPDQAFRFSAEADGPDKIRLDGQIFPDCRILFIEREM